MKKFAMLLAMLLCLTSVALAEINVTEEGNVVRIEFSFPNHNQEDIDALNEVLSEGAYAAVMIEDVDMMYGRETQVDGAEREFGLMDEGVIRCRKGRADETFVFSDWRIALEVTDVEYAEGFDFEGFERAWVDANPGRRTEETLISRFSEIGKDVALVLHRPGGAELEETESDGSYTLKFDYERSTPNNLMILNQKLEGKRFSELDLDLENNTLVQAGNEVFCGVMQGVLTGKLDEDGDYYYIFSEVVDQADYAARDEDSRYKDHWDDAHPQYQMKQQIAIEYNNAGMNAFIVLARFNPS